MAEKNLTFESFFQYLNEKNDSKQTGEPKTLSKRPEKAIFKPTSTRNVSKQTGEPKTLSKRPERAIVKHTSTRNVSKQTGEPKTLSKRPERAIVKHTSTRNVPYLHEVESEDESVINPFDDSSDSFDGGDYEWNPESCSESSDESNCGAGVKPTHDDLPHLKKREAESKLVSLDSPEAAQASLSWARFCERPSTADCEDAVENSRSSLGSEVFPALTTAEEELSTVSLAKRGTAKNKWDKKHSCLFCSKQVNKMSTHLQRVHKNESSVLRVLAMAKGSAERRLAWAELLNQGDFQHNYKVLESGSGQLIPKYRTKSRTADDVVVCSFCKGLYGKSLLYIHYKTCSKRRDHGQEGKGQAVRKGSMLMPLPQNVSSKFFEHIVSRMNKDVITKIVINDSLIVKFGERKFYATDVEEHTAGHISSRVRELGRLMQIIRQNTEMKVSSLGQALHPGNFDIVIQAVRELAEFSEDNHHFKKGSLALRLGHSIKKCVSVLRAEAIKTEDEELVKQADRFDNLFSGDWYDYVSANAGQSINKERFNKPKLLPACADVEKVHALLESEMGSNDYATLTKATLCSISLFNRKRGGEVQRLRLEDFEKGISGVPSDPELYQDLSELEKKLISHFSRIEIRGKFCRKVPILLTPTMVDSLNHIICLREKMDPPITNKYLFATRTGERPYRGSDVIREFAKKAEVADVTLFTFTHLRKQVATLSQTLHITKWEQDQLATFLGHDIRVHRSIYRQPLEVLDRAKVAKILLAVNKGVDVDLEKECGAIENDEIDCDPHNEAHQEDLESDEGEPESETESEARTKMSSEMASATNLVDEPQRNSEGLKGRKKMKRQPWSEDEIKAVRRHLNHCIVSGVVPRKDQAMKAVAAETCLRSRSWRNVKDFVYNLIKKQRRH